MAININLEGNAHFIEDLEVSTVNQKKIIAIPIRKIKLNKLNKVEDTEEEILNFANSLYQEGGVADPITVYKNPDETFTLISGEKRTKASQVNLKLHADAPTVLPAIIVDKPEDEIEEIQQIFKHNQYRKYNEKQLYNLAEQCLLVYNALCERKERPKGEKRVWLAQQLAIGVKHAEKIMWEIDGKKVAKRKAKIPLEEEDMNIRALRNSMQHHLGTKVKITRNALTINYCGTEDLNRILEILDMDNVVNQ